MQGTAPDMQRLSMPLDLVLRLGKGSIDLPRKKNKFIKAIGIILLTRLW